MRRGYGRKEKKEKDELGGKRRRRGENRGKKREGTKIGGMERR